MAQNRWFPNDFVFIFTSVGLIFFQGYTQTFAIHLLSGRWAGILLWIMATFQQSLVDHSRHWLLQAFEIRDDGLQCLIAGVKSHHDCMLPVYKLYNQGSMIICHHYIPFIIGIYYSPLLYATSTMMIRLNMARLIVFFTKASRCRNVLAHSCLPNGSSSQWIFDVFFPGKRGAAMAVKIIHGSVEWTGMGTVGKN